LFALCEAEKVARLEGEKQLQAKFDYQIYLLREALEEERSLRVVSLKDIRNDIDLETKA